LSEIEHLATFDNQLKLLDLSGCTDLKILSCGNNILTSLDASSLINLESLSCHDNKDLSDNYLLTIPTEKLKFFIPNEASEELLRSFLPEGEKSTLHNYPLLLIIYQFYFP
jgi:hypothetical protein